MVRFTYAVYSSFAAASWRFLYTARQNIQFSKIDFDCVQQSRRFTQTSEYSLLISDSSLFQYISSGGPG